MQQTLARSGAASVTSITADDGGKRWTIAGGSISKTIAWQAEGGLQLVALENRAAHHTWQPDLQAQPAAGGEFALTWNGVTWSARQATALQGVRASGDSNVVMLEFDLRLGETLDVTLCYRAYAQLDVLEQWLVVMPQRAGTLSRVAPVTVSIAAMPSPTLHWVRGLQGHGWHMPAAGPYPAFQVRHEALGAVTLESGLRSTWHEIAWFALDSSATGQAPDAAGGAGLFAGLIYSGRWSARAQADAGSTEDGAETSAETGVENRGVALDLCSEGYTTALRAWEVWMSPAAFVGVYRGDLDAAAHAQHAYMRAAVVPATAADFPWVQYNTWFAHLVDIDEALLRREADLAARLGAEVFVIDAGWWEPSRRTSDNFTTGLGSWQPSSEKFPSGLPAFGDYVRGLGMRFGIWVEPERVDLRPPASWRLDWLARHNDAIVSPPWPPDTVSGWLCFGHPDVQAWALDWISSLVASVGADWLKWDSNWWGVCTCAHHGHGAGDGEFAQVQGVHTVLSALRARFPNLMIENCAGGGTRTDFAMLANSHASWLHDASTPSRRVRFHLAGATYPFPPELCNTFIIDAEDEPLTDKRSTRAEIDAIARSRMLGAMGVSARLPEWTETAFAAVQDAIVQYKRLRPLLKSGYFHHLLPQPELPCPTLEPQGEWEAYAIIDPAQEQGALWAFRPTNGAPSSVVPLKGLAADRAYQFTDVDTGQSVTAGGAQWMQAGLPIDLSERTSALLLLQALDAGAAGEQA